MTPLLNNLAEAHVTWMQAPSLQQVFKYHYHSEVKDTAAQYAELLRLCIEGTQGWKPCADLYKQWLEAKEIKPDNLVLRALLNNDASLLKAVRDLKLPPTTSLNVTALTDKIGIPVLAQGFSSLGNAVASHHKALASELMGPLTELMGEALEKDVAKLSLSVLAAVEGKGLKIVPFPETTLPQLMADLTQCVQEANPNMSSQTSELAVSRMMSKYDPKNFGANKPMKCIFAIDEKQLAKVYNKGTAEGAILPLEEMKNLEPNRFRTIKAAGGLLSISALLCQTASIYKSLRDFKDVPLWNKTEEGARLLAGVAGYISAIGSTVITLRNPASIMGLEKAAALKAFQWIGFGAAVANGLVDAAKTIQAAMKHDWGEAALYFGSAVTGVASAWILTFASTTGWVPWVGWGLLLAYVGLQYFISTWSRRDIQSWLERCSFGKEPGFKDAAAEYDTLNKAMGWA